MKCDRCGSNRVLETHAHASDCQNYSLGDLEMNGYAPKIRDICSGDDLFPTICLNCGQCQGEFPLPPTDLERTDEDE